MEDIVNKTLEYVKEFFKNDFSGHDFYHTLRVYNLAKYIANIEKCDKELVCLSALLHDADDHKLFKTENNANARFFLAKNDVPEESIEQGETDSMQPQEPENDETASTEEEIIDTEPDNNDDTNAIENSEVIDTEDTILDDLNPQENTSAIDF